MLSPLLAILAIAVNVFIVSNSQLAVTDAELKNIINELRLLDDNKASAGDIHLNYQNMAYVGTQRDFSSNKLFTNVSNTLLNRATIQRLGSLYDNYIPKTGVPEIVSQQELTENDDFLMAVLATRIGARFREFLLQKGYSFANSIASLKEKLKELWFTSYSRAAGQLDTSGFEHVFIGEYLSYDVGGLHNWLRFYFLENANKMDYSGYIVRRNKDLCVTLVFKWDYMWKKIGGFFVGTSPEFDLSVLTLCFLIRPGKDTCQFHIDNEPFTVTSYAQYQNGRTYIGTAYPTC